MEGTLTASAFGSSAGPLSSDSSSSESSSLLGLFSLLLKVPLGLELSKRRFMLVFLWLLLISWSSDRFVFCWIDSKAFFRCFSVRFVTRCLFNWTWATIPTKSSSTLCPKPDDVSMNLQPTSLANFLAAVRKICEYTFEILSLRFKKYLEWEPPDASPNLFCYPPISLLL